MDPPSSSSHLKSQTEDDEDDFDQRKPVGDQTHQKDKRGITPTISTKSKPHPTKQPLRATTSRQSHLRKPQFIYRQSLAHAFAISLPSSESKYLEETIYELRTSSLKVSMLTGYNFGNLTKHIKTAKSSTTAQISLASVISSEQTLSPTPTPTSTNTKNIEHLELECRPTEQMGIDDKSDLVSSRVNSEDVANNTIRPVYSSSLPPSVHAELIDFDKQNLKNVERLEKQLVRQSREHDIEMVDHKNEHDIEMVDLKNVRDIEMADLKNEHDIEMADLKRQVRVHDIERADFERQIYELTNLAATSSFVESPDDSLWLSITNVKLLRGKSSAEIHTNYKTLAKDLMHYKTEDNSGGGSLLKKYVTFIEKKYSGGKSDLPPPTVIQQEDDNCLVLESYRYSSKPNVVYRLIQQFVVGKCHQGKKKKLKNSVIKCRTTEKSVEHLFTLFLVFF